MAKTNKDITVYTNVEKIVDSETGEILHAISFIK